LQNDRFVKRQQFRQFNASLKEPRLRTDAAALQEKMVQANNNLHAVQDGTDGKLDAQGYRQLSKLHRVQAASGVASTSLFEIDDFGLRWAKKHKLPLLDDQANKKAKKRRINEEEDEQAEGKAAAWTALGTSLASQFNQAPTLTFMLGAFNPASEEDLARQKEALAMSSRLKLESRRLAAAPKATTKIRTDGASSAAAQNEDDRVEAIVKSIYRQLRERCKRSQGERVGLFEFALNSRSFGESVENLFHISFLIKVMLKIYAPNANRSIKERKVLLIEGNEQDMHELQLPIKKKTNLNDVTDQVPELVSLVSILNANGLAHFECQQEQVV